MAPRHQHSNSCGSLSADLLGPVIVGPSISVDDWVPEKPPERPPKNPHLRTAFPDLFQSQRALSPDLPPPSPPTVLEDEVFNSDDPLPPPPLELQHPEWNEFSGSLKESRSSNRQYAVPQVESNTKGIMKEGSGTADNNKKPETVPEMVKNKQNSAVKTELPSKPSKQPSETKPYPEQILSFPTQKTHQERSSTRYPSVLLNGGTVATSQKVVNGISNQYRAEPLKPQQDDSGRHVIMNKVNQRASIAESSSRDIPPPLQPRQMRINQSMRAKLPDRQPVNLTRLSPPKQEKQKETRPLNYTM